jgi:hypothetical protein
MKSVHSDRLERWLGTERINHISQNMKGWYGPPIHLLDCPGSVRVCGDGDFIGPFERGYFMSAMDSLERAFKRAAKLPDNTLYTGFASISDALARASGGFSQQPGGMFNLVGPTGVVGVTTSLHKVGPQPIAGVAAAAAPGGTAFSKSDTGAMIFTNPAAGGLRLVGADVSASIISNTLLLYDRIFGVAKTMNSTSNEAVTGVPTRYQSAVGTDEDFAGGNFLFVEVGLTALSATSHNWDTCLYTDESGNAGAALPTLVGNSGAITHRLDHPVNQWFAPLAGGDVGIKNLTQMHCSAAVSSGLINFVIGHPLGFMSFPVINSMLPFDWLTNRNQAPRIFDDAYLEFLEINKPTTTATTYTGVIYATSTAS